MKYADLHVHTFYSDSTFSPEEVISCARDKGLSAVAICDHDCTDGIEPCMEFASRSGMDIDVIPGVELTAEKDDVEIHMLGYFIDWRDAQFQKRLEVIREGRVSRMYKMIEKLKGAGIDIESDKVIKMAGRGSVGRLHLARAMLEAKQIKTLEEAFRKYIGFLKPCYVRNIHFTPQEAIDLILKMKGVPVIAHPFTMKRDDLVSEFVEYGIRGIEVYHTDHDSVTTKHYKQMAEEYGLIATGGSDCHGLGKGKILMGGIRVPFSVVAQLKLEASKVA